MELIWMFWCLLGMIFGAVTVHCATKDLYNDKVKEVEYYKRLSIFYYKLASLRRIKDE